MSIFGNILDKIFHRSPSGSGNSGQGTAGTATPPPNGNGPAAAGADAAVQNPATQATKPVDVEAVLTEMAQKNAQKLNWRTSIVDLMKLLDLDSGLNARKELATELGYAGVKDGSAEMNLWLHERVMKKLAENGGKVPAQLHN